MPVAAFGRRFAAGLFVVLSLVGVLATRSSAADPLIELKQGDHICLIGNTLADRMQHDGWLETYLQTRFPNLDLAIRNLGYAADELVTRPRNDNFGDPTKHLTHSKADVIFAFFGYNESFRGEAGPAAVQAAARAVHRPNAAAKYNGTSAPRLVLFSPIAFENTKNPHLPDGKAENERLAMYTKAMAEVAAEKKVPFVDLFDPTAKLYASAKQPLTINGIHLTDDGNRALAEVIDAALFATPVTRSRFATRQAARSDRR